MRERGERERKEREERVLERRENEREERGENERGERTTLGQKHALAIIISVLLAVMGSSS